MFRFNTRTALLSIDGTRYLYNRVQANQVDDGLDDGDVILDQPFDDDATFRFTRQMAYLVFHNTRYTYERAVAGNNDITVGDISENDECENGDDDKEGKFVHFKVLNSCVLFFF